MTTRPYRQPLSPAERATTAPATLVAASVLAAGIAAALWSLASPAPTQRSDVAPEFAGARAARRLVWLDRRGRVTPLPAPPRGYVYPRLSPDGRRIALDVRDERHGLWLWDIAAARLVALSVGRASDISPVWSHDGRWLLFARGRGAAPGLFRLPIGQGGVMPPADNGEVPSDGIGPARRLPVESNSLLLPGSLLPGDRSLLVTTSVATGFDVWAVDLDEKTAPVPFVTSAADDLNPEVSPDGQWVAFQSRASGQFEIWLAPAPALAGATTGGATTRSQVDAPRHQVTSSGGTRPVWTRGGRELMYLTTDGEVMTMSVAFASAGGTGGPAGTITWPVVGVPERLFQADIYRDLVGRTFDVTPDGDRLLAIVDGLHEGDSGAGGQVR